MKCFPEAKIINLYNKLLLEGDLTVLEQNDFFLLRPHIQNLGSLLNTWTSETIDIKKPILHAMAVEILRIFNYERGLKLFNAAQTFGVLVDGIARPVNSIVNDPSLIFPVSLETFSMIFCRCFHDVITSNSSYVLKQCLMNTMVIVWNSFCRIEASSALRSLANDTLFDALLAVFVNQELKDLQWLALDVFLFAMHCTDGSKFCQRLAELDDNTHIISIADMLYQQLSLSTEKFIKTTIPPRNLLNLTTQLFGFFKAERNTPENIFSDADRSLSTLLFLLSAVRCNRNFAVMIISPPQLSNSIYGHVTMSNNCSIFSQFLSFASFTFANYETETYRHRSELCLLILWYIVDEPYIQSSMQDINLSTSIALYRAPMLHRSASFELISTNPSKLSSALFQLLSDFNFTHLMQSFPFYHYHLSFSIIHSLLVFQKKCRIKIERNTWRPLFSSFLSVLDFLTLNATKLATDKMLDIIYQSLVVVNFFITYGDTFLPDAAAYDFLYYEISRQSSIFVRLNMLMSEISRKPGFNLNRHSLSKIEDFLLNIEAIIENIRPKLENLAHSYPTEEQVINIVQKCFSELTLKLFNGLEIVEHPNLSGLETLLYSLTRDIPPLISPFWPVNVDYIKVAETLSNIES